MRKISLELFQPFGKLSLFLWILATFVCKSSGLFDLGDVRAELTHLVVLLLTAVVLFSDVLDLLFVLLKSFECSPPVMIEVLLGFS